MAEGDNDKGRAILADYLPAKAVEPIYDYIKRNRVLFNIKDKRSSKLGDYRMPGPGHLNHQISINYDLSPHMFLLVTLHEMAHLNTFLKYGRRVQPHGHEWQTEYRALMVEYVGAGCFPQESVPYFAKYLKQIPLSRTAGNALERFLHEYDCPEEALSTVRVRDLKVGDCFVLKERPGMMFRNEGRQRTRYRCTELETGRTYSISADAEVIS